MRWLMFYLSNHHYWVVVLSVLYPEYLALKRLDYSSKVISLLSLIVSNFVVFVSNKLELHFFIIFFFPFTKSSFINEFTFRLLCLTSLYMCVTWSGLVEWGFVAAKLKSQNLCHWEEFKSPLEYFLSRGGLKVYSHSCSSHQASFGVTVKGLHGPVLPKRLNANIEIY